MSLPTLLLIIVFMAAFLGYCHWKLRRTKTRRPLGEDVKVARLPGEHLQRKATQLLESLFFKLAGWLLFLPLGVFYLTLACLRLIGGLEPVSSSIAVISLTAAAALVGMRVCY